MADECYFLAIFLLAFLGKSCACAVSLCRQQDLNHCFIGFGPVRARMPDILVFGLSPFFAVVFFPILGRAKRL